MMKSKMLFAACAAVFCGSVLAADVPSVKKPVAVSKLGKDDAAVFVRLTAARTARFDELAVFQRVIREKESELKEANAELEKKHGLDPKKDYLYEAAAHRLFELVPAKKDGVEPTRKEVKSFKDTKEAEPLANAMMARKLVENQLQVLGQLMREKAKEAEIVDVKIHKMFKLDNDGLYSFDTADSTIYRTGTKPKPAK